MKKHFIPALLVFFVPFFVLSQEIKITHGPYIQDVDKNEVNSFFDER